MTTHAIKVQPPYFDALLDKSKTFEVRKNDRGFQRGDRLWFREWIDVDAGNLAAVGYKADGYTGREGFAEITYVYTGDPRFGGIERGYVVLALNLGLFSEEGR